MPEYRDPAKLNYIQSRRDTSLMTIKDYQIMMQDGVEFDPIDAIQDEESNIFVWDGYHRGKAAQLAEMEIRVNIWPGDKEQAEWMAIAANKKHGLRRTNADKRKIIKLALRHPHGAGKSNREIAKYCGVDPKTVGTIRKEMETSEEIPQMETRTVTRNGQEYEQKIKATKYVPVWELEKGVKSWIATLEAMKRDTNYPIEILKQIKSQDIYGRKQLRELTISDALPGPRRQRDVLQACNNVLSQLKTDQEPILDNKEIAALDKIKETNLKRKQWQEEQATLAQEILNKLKEDISIEIELSLHGSSRVQQKVFSTIANHFLPQNKAKTPAETAIKLASMLGGNITHHNQDRGRAMLRAALIREESDLRADMAVIEAHIAIIADCATEIKLGGIRYDQLAKKSIEFCEVWFLKHQSPEQTPWQEQFEKAKTEWEAIKTS